MAGAFDFGVREIRKELGISQAELAALVGVSKRAIQSYEQEWRQPSEMVQRGLLLIIIARRNGGELAARRCWEHKECALEVRKQCIAYATQQGHLCWFLTGTLCEGQRMKTWKAKWEQRLKCDFCRVLLAGARGEDRHALVSSAELDNMGGIASVIRAVDGQELDHGGGG